MCVFGGFDTQAWYCKDIKTKQDSQAPGGWFFGQTLWTWRGWRGRERADPSFHCSMYTGFPRSPWTAVRSLWERQWAVTTPSQTQVARTYLSHTETVKEPWAKMYRSMKSGVSDARASRGQGSTTGDLSTTPPPAPRSAPQRGQALSSSQCLPRGDVGSAFPAILIFGE